MDNITKIETQNTGGGCMVDIITLHCGRVLVINEDHVCMYENEDAFYASSEGDVSGYVAGFQYSLR